MQKCFDKVKLKANIKYKKIAYFLALLGEKFFSLSGWPQLCPQWNVLIARVLWPKFRPLATLFAQFAKASCHLPLLHTTLPKSKFVFLKFT